MGRRQRARKPAPKPLWALCRASHPARRRTTALLPGSDPSRGPAQVELALIANTACPRVRTRLGGGGGNRTRVLRLLVGPSPSAADRRLSRTPLLSAAAASRIRQRVPAGQPEQPTSELHSMTPDHQPMEQRLGGRRYCLSSVRELRLGVCFVFRLFNVAPETTARFSQLDYRSRDLSPPCVGTAVRSDDLALCPNAPLSLPRRRRGSFGPAPAVLSRARSSAARCGAPSRSPARLRG